MQELNKIKFFSSFFVIKFLENRLEVIKIWGSVLYFFLLILKILFNFNSSYVNKSPRLIKIFLKKRLELILE